MKFTIIDTVQEKKQKLVTPPAAKPEYINRTVTSVTTVTEIPIMACGSGLASIAFCLHQNTLVRVSNPKTRRKKVSL